MAEAPNKEPTASLETRMLADIGDREKLGLEPSMTRIANRSDKPIFLIPICCPDGALPLLSRGTVRDELARKIPVRNFIPVDRRHYEPNKINPRCRCRIYILFRAGDNAENVQEFLARFHKRYPNGVAVEGDALLIHYQLNMPFLYLNCNERGQVTVEDENARQIPFAGNRLSSGMEFFRNARVVRLRNRHGKYLLEGPSGRMVELGDISSFADTTKWSIEFVLNSDSALRLKSCYGKYLAASDQRSLQSFAGRKVLLYPAPLNSSVEFVPVMEGTQVKLRTHFSTFLRDNEHHIFSPNRVTHDLPHCTTIFFDVEVVERKEEESASNIDDKASEEGSATKRYHETGKGNSVTKSPPGDSGLYRGHFWKLKNLLSDNSGRKDVLIRGGSGTTAFVRELCADMREYFGTIAWISIPQENDSELIREEILAQLIFERGAFFEKFDGQPWKLSDHKFSLQQKARCLIVVDNLDDPKTWEKFEEIFNKDNTSRVIFIAKREMASPCSQIYQDDRELETYELEDLSYVPWGYNCFLDEVFPSPSKEFCQLIVRKCERLPAAIVFVLGNGKDSGYYCSSEIWEASIPSDDVCRELRFIQKVLENLCRYDHLFCFLYLCVFPENSRFSCERVSLLWFAEGFLPRWITAESLGYKTTVKRIFHHLLRIQCIRPVERRSNGQLLTFEVVKRVREIMVSLPVLRNPVNSTSQGCQKVMEAWQVH